MRTIQITVNDRTSTYEDTKKRVEPYLYSNFEVSDIVNAIGIDGLPKIIVKAKTKQASPPKRRPCVCSQG